MKHSFSGSVGGLPHILLNMEENTNLLVSSFMNIANLTPSLFLKIKKAKTIKNQSIV